MRQVPSNKEVTTMTKSGIYRINLGNGWFYIGSSANMGGRKQNHLSDLNRQKHCNQKMQAIYNKYQVFKFEVLFECAIEELIIKEQVLLDAHFTDGKCANILPNARSRVGIKHSPETRAKMSAAHKGRKHSAEHRAKLSAARKGKPMSAETRANMSGRVWSAESRAKSSASQKGVPKSAETRAKISESAKIDWKKRKEKKAKSAKQ